MIESPTKIMNLSRPPRATWRDWFRHSDSLPASSGFHCLASKETGDIIAGGIRIPRVAS